MQVLSHDANAAGRHFRLQLLTASRIPLAIVFALVLPSRSSADWGLFCLAVLAAIELTDLLDGWIARRYSLESDWGKGFDPFADSFARLVVYWGLAGEGFVWLQVPLIMALRDLTVAYARLAAQAAGASIAARSSGKVKAIVQATGALAVTSVAVFELPLPAISTVVSTCVVAITVGSAFDYAAAARRAFRAADQGP